MLAAFACALALSACGGGDDPQPITSAPDARRPRPRRHAAAAKVDRFNADRAWSLLEYQVEPRPAPVRLGSVQAARRLHQGAAAARPLREPCPAGCATSWARSRARARRSCSPRTTTPRTSRASSGANDGAGGTAQMLEIARGHAEDEAAQVRAADLLRLLRRRGGDRRQRLLRHRHARLEGVREEARARRSASSSCSTSSPTRTSRSRASRTRTRGCGRSALGRQAGRFGGRVPGREQGAVLDDHTPFIRRGVPRST